MTYDETLQDTISYDDFLELGLNGRDNSAEKRAYLGYKLHLGKPNAKTLFKRLNMLQLKKQDVEELLKNYHE